MIEAGLGRAQNTWTDMTRVLNNHWHLTSSGGIKPLPAFRPSPTLLSCVDCVLARLRRPRSEIYYATGKRSSPLSAILPTGIDAGKTRHARCMSPHDCRASFGFRVTTLTVLEVLLLRAHDLDAFSELLSSKSVSSPFKPEMAPGCAAKLLL